MIDNSSAFDSAPQRNLLCVPGDCWLLTAQYPKGALRFVSGLWWEMLPQLAAPLGRATVTVVAIWVGPMPALNLLALGA